MPFFSKVKVIFVYLVVWLLILLLTLYISGQTEESKSSGIKSSKNTEKSWKIF